MKSGLEPTLATWECLRFQSSQASGIVLDFGISEALYGFGKISLTIADLNSWKLGDSNLSVYKSGSIAWRLMMSELDAIYGYTLQSSIW